MFTQHWYADSALNKGMTLAQEVDQLIHALYIDTADAHTQTCLLTFKRKKTMAVLALSHFLKAVTPYLGGRLPYALIGAHCFQLSTNINMLMEVRSDLWRAFEQRQRLHRLAEEDLTSLKERINRFTGVLLRRHHSFIVTLLEPLTLDPIDLIDDLARIVSDDDFGKNLDVHFIPSLALLECNAESRVMRMAVENLLASIRLNMKVASITKDQYCSG